MDVVVVGSCMTDQTCYAPRLPRPGETVHGSSFTLSFGGKGANQCVMAAKLGATTAMVAKLGDDSFGSMYLDNLQKEGVDCSHVTRTSEAMTGVAQICVDQSGSNSIVIVAGANHQLTAADVHRADSVIAAASVMLCQFEVSMDATMAALRSAKRHNVRTIVNAAPAVPISDEEFYLLTDLLCVNEAEAAVMSGLEVGSVRQAEVAAVALLKRGCRSVLVTLGENGAVLVPGDDVSGTATPVHVLAGPAVTVVDTTGAGDAFLGALAYYTACMPRLSVLEAVRRACHVATVSVAQPGTQTSFPSRKQLPGALFL